MTAMAKIDKRTWWECPTSPLAQCRTAAYRLLATRQYWVDTVRRGCTHCPGIRAVERTLRADTMLIFWADRLLQSIGEREY